MKINIGIDREKVPFFHFDELLNYFLFFSVKGGTLFPVNK